MHGSIKLQASMGKINIIDKIAIENHEQEKMETE